MNVHLLNEQIYYITPRGPNATVNLNYFLLVPG